jgi:hypothetical protein
MYERRTRNLANQASALKRANKYLVWDYNLENNNKYSKSYNYGMDILCTHFTASALTMNEQSMMYLVYNTNTTYV